MTTPTEARELIEEQAWDEGIWFIPVTASEGYLQQKLRALNSVVESLADQVEALEKDAERYREALTILDGFKGPPPTKAQWDSVCVLAWAVKKALASPSESAELDRLRTETTQQFAMFTKLNVHCAAAEKERATLRKFLREVVEDGAMNLEWTERAEKALEGK